MVESPWKSWFVCREINTGQSFDRCMASASCGRATCQHASRCDNVRSVHGVKANGATAPKWQTFAGTPSCEGLVVALCDAYRPLSKQSAPPDGRC
jgi:hypothetical protein